MLAQKISLVADLCDHRASDYREFTLPSLGVARRRSDDEERAAGHEAFEIKPSPLARTLAIDPPALRGQAKVNDILLAQIRYQLEVTRYTYLRTALAFAVAFSKAKLPKESLESPGDLFLYCNK